MRKLRNPFSGLATVAIIATVIVTVPQTPLEAPKSRGEPGWRGGAIRVAGDWSHQYEECRKCSHADDVGISMQNITLALGKNCDFCLDDRFFACNRLRFFRTVQYFSQGFQVGFRESWHKKIDNAL